jgi:hypothetical protein
MECFGDRGGEGIHFIMTNGIKIQVTCYSGHTAHERPVSFVLGNTKFEVRELIDRWYGPDYLYFKVSADDGNIYILKYDEKNDEWSLEMYMKTADEN